MKKAVVAICCSLAIVISACGTSSEASSKEDNSSITTEESVTEEPTEKTEEETIIESNSASEDSIENKEPEDSTPTQPRCEGRTAYVGTGDTVYYSDMFFYDDSDRLIRIDRYLPNYQNTVSIYEASYNEDGNKVYEYQQYVVGNEVMAFTTGPYEYTYDEQGNWIKREYKGGGSDVVTSENTYEDGKLMYRYLVFEDRGTDGTVEYTYSEEGEHSEDRYYDGSLDWTLSYDAKGNLLYSQMGEYFWQSFTYDDQGNLTYSFQSDGGYNYEEEYYITNKYDSNNVLSEAYYKSQNSLPDLKMVYFYKDYESHGDAVASEEDPFARYSSFENCRLTTAHEFHNGYAWIEFTDQDKAQEYMGCIDKNGNLILYMDQTRNEPTPFDENGVSLLRIDDKNKTISIDLAGTTNTIIETDSQCMIQSDYSLFVKTESGFDVNKTTYEIYAPDGRLVKELVEDSNHPSLFINYHGGGIFSFMDENSQVCGVDFYFAKNDIYLSRQVGSQALIEKAFANKQGWNGKYLLFFCGEYNGEVFLSITDDEGNVRDITIPEEYGDEPVVQDCSKRFILLRNAKDFYYIYDIEKDTFRKVDGQYTDRLYWASYPYDALQKAHCSDEAIAIQLRGQDDESYIGLYNPETMQLLCEPFKGGDAEVVNKAVVANTNLYDLSGKLIGTFSYSPSIVYSEGVYSYYDITTEHRFAGYYDDTFNNLFPDGINYTGAKFINMNNQ